MTRAGDGETMSQGITKPKRSMRKCEACRHRKIACDPKDRTWSEGVQEKCNNCYKLDLSCGPSVRSNAKVDAGPRKLASKGTAEAHPASRADGATSSTSLQVARSLIDDIDPGMRSQSLSRDSVHVDRSYVGTWQTQGDAMAIDPITPQHIARSDPRIYGGAGNFRETYESMPPPVAIATGSSSAPTTLPHGFVSTYAGSVRSRGAKLEDVPYKPGIPVPGELRSQNDLQSFMTSQFPESGLRQLRTFDLNSRHSSPEHLLVSNRQYDEAPNDLNPPSACELVPLQNERSFRLFQLYPGQVGELLEGRLTLASFESNIEPRYETLSYVWGPPSTKPVNISIATGNTVIRAAIQPNLANALQFLRYTGQSRTFWIDALCINQENYAEKSKQVGLMATIYTKAAGVCAWLGPESKNSHLAFELITESASVAQFEMFTQNTSIIPHWDSFLELLRRPWFSRMWCLQEVALARNAKLHCGPLQAGWDQFELAVSLFSSKCHDMKRVFRSATERLFDALHDVSQLDINRFIEIVNTTVRKSDSGEVLQYLQSLESLVSRCSNFGALDPRDKVYALLGLAAEPSLHRSSAGITSRARLQDDDYAIPESTRDHEPPTVNRNSGSTSTTSRSIFDFINIDYSKSVFMVFRDFVLYAVRSSGSLDIICRPWAPTGQDLPSWMPTVSGSPYVCGKDGFHRRASANPLVGTPNFNGVVVYNAARHTSPLFVCNTQSPSPELRVLGFTCGAVAAKKSPATGGIIPHNWFKLEDWAGLEGMSKDCLRRTLVADRGQESIFKPPTTDALAYHYILDQMLLGGNLHTAEFLAAGEQLPIVHEFLTRVQSVTWGRRLLLISVGDRKLLGLGPEHTKKRDLICILYGCSVPVLLRKVDGEEGDEVARYRLVGECYVHGIMNGEAFGMKDMYKLKEREFNLV